MAQPKDMAIAKLTTKRNNVMPRWYGNWPETQACQNTWATVAGVGKVLLCADTARLCQIASKANADMMGMTDLGKFKTVSST